ncbi:MAG: hydrogenase maturation protease [Candidatus Aegiribacteria sp.]|nr:hydrogenase maturation protease [Candidatus Aegiribacteria sp.]
MVYMGIGNILRGDDGIGPELLARLSGKGLCTVDAGTVPENYIGPVARLDPDTVVIIDAVHLEREPGAVELLDRSEIMGNTSFTTHTLSPVLVMERLEEETGARVIMLAIQPGTLEFGAPLSPEVARLLEVLPDLLIN